MNHTQMYLAERARRFPECFLWHPASGHPGGWRVVREAMWPEPPLVEHLTSRGHRRLYKSRESALQVATKLNKTLPPLKL